MDPAIHLHAVDKKFGSFQALNGLTLSVNKGEIVGLLGPNGSGKTTTLRLLAGYLRPDHGDVRICGLPPDQTSTRATLRLGYLPEKAPLYDALPITGYLDFIAGARGLAGAARRQAVEQALIDYDLLPMRQRRIATLSKGYRQRVGLAQATIGDPEVLLLDEATNGLDPLQMIEVRALIRRAGQGRAVLFSSHLMQEVVALCSRVYIVQAGRVVAERRLDGLADLRQIDVRADGMTADDLHRLLAAIPGVVTVTARPADHGIACRCQLDGHHDPRAEIAATVVARGQLLALVPVAPNLEDMFMAAIRPDEVAA